MGSSPFPVQPTRAFPLHPSARLGRDEIVRLLAITWGDFSLMQGLRRPCTGNGEEPTNDTLTIEHYDIDQI